ncbi:MAG: carbon storage regulator CsrA [Clostridium sp.]|nr:carbon storage regulator CsrA [Clostridium sp.]
MLVVRRKEGESLLIGDNVEIKIIEVENGSVKIAIEAPKEVTILRGELYNQIKEENKESSELDLSILKNFNRKQK